MNKSGLDFNHGIAVDSNGDLIVGNLYGGVGAGTRPLVLRIDPSTGSQETVSNGDILQDVGDLIVDHTGEIIAVGNIFSGSPPGLFKINPVTGSQTEFSSGGFF